MATVNERVKKPQATVINGVDNGGTMTAEINAGYENVIKSAPDGLQIPVQDREVQFVRGSVVTQDWVEFINLLTGTVGTYVFYERKSGVADATGYIEHTITNPVIHRARMDFNKGGYATVTFDFECKAADETKTISDMWSLTDDQSAPTYVTAARGGYRVESIKHNPGVSEVDIYHTISFSFELALNLVRACNDADVAYTCVDAELDNMMVSGSLTFQDGTISTSMLKAQTLVLASAADLQIQVTQGQGETSQVITIANVLFNNMINRSDASADFTGYTCPFDIANDAGTPLTLEGDNKIITIAPAA